MADQAPSRRPENFGALAIELLHCDAAWIVINKPAGLPSVPGRGPELADCASARVQALYLDALVVHRLDMATSGLLLMARGAVYQRSLSQAFAQRKVHKIYEALVAGEVAEDQGLIDAPLIADWPRRPVQKVDCESGKASQTQWSVMARAPGLTRLRLHPLTGRTHQLRVHLAHIGHPILGDTLYGAQDLAAVYPRMMLHARGLSLAHPVSGETADFSSPTPF